MPKFKKRGKHYREILKHQTQEWLKGNSIHNTEYGECCPDFSCCVPEMKASDEERRKFVDHPELRDEMLAMFLGRMLRHEGCNVITSSDL